MALYHDILGIARDFMGPAAEDYVNRRIRIVLRGDPPETMLPEKLDRLAAGIEMTAKVYMSPAKASAFRREVLALKERYPAAPE